MSSVPSVLLIGLPWDHPEVTKLIANPTIVHNGLKAAADSIHNAGYVYDFFPIGAEDAAAKNALAVQLGEKNYNGVIFGFGVRGVAGITAFFEDTINAVKDMPPKVKLLFNFNLTSTLNAVKRNFPL